MCSQCSPLFCRFAKFGTGEGLLLYRMDARYRRRAPMVRDAFSKALGAKNRLLRYGRGIRCKKQPSLVRDAHPKARRTASTRRRANIKEGDQKVFCSPSYGLPNPRRLTSATPIRGISRLRCGPFGTFGAPLLIYGMSFTLRPIRP